MIITRALRVLGVVGVSSLVACGGSRGEDVGSGGTDVRSCATGTLTKGIDVSHYDGAIDWGRVKASGIDFAFAKATQALSSVDSKFAANWSGMKAAGIVRGAYHFFNAAEDPSAQAVHFLATVGPLDAGDLPVVLDFESLDGVSEATAVAHAVTFLDAVSASTSKTAILYMSSGFLSSSHAALAPYLLWVANYGVSCPGLPSTWSKWTFWQNSETGSTSGISGAVDLDYFNGTLQELVASTGENDGGSSSGGSSGGSTGDGGGQACATSGDCNPGNDGSGLMCVGGACVPGCDASWECPGSTTCVNGTCR